jgi:catechol-2,3-dioxygenase
LYGPVFFDYRLKPHDMKIKKLTLATTNLRAQIEFYHHLLGFSLIKESPEAAEFQTGNSILRLEASSEATPYHFAFNIPSFQEHQALEWLKTKVPILKEQAEEIMVFESWNARAIYFYDRDNNILEFIARRNLNIEVDEPFSAASVIEISEMGLPVDDIIPIHDHFINKLNIEVYSGSTERFCAIGDEHGLFIVLNKNVKTSWFPTENSPIASDFKTIIELRDQLYSVTFRNKHLFTHELEPDHHSFRQFA